MLEKINNDIIDAMKSKDTLKLATLRMLKGAIELERINTRKDITDEDIVIILGKQIKTRKESIEEFKKGNRTDLVDKTTSEIDLLNNYMPEMLSEEEITKVIDEAMELTGAKTISEMGKVMKEVSPKLRGKADMALVSNIIKNKLN